MVGWSAGADRPSRERKHVKEMPYENSLTSVYIMSIDFCIEEGVVSNAFIFMAFYYSPCPASIVAPLNHTHYLNLAGGKGAVSQGFFGPDMIAMEGAKKEEE